jgi:hypothetical protein
MRARAYVHSLGVVCVVAAALVSSPPAAAAPANDDYLAATLVADERGGMPRETAGDVQDTRDATVQADLFAPPGAGGGPERTRCDGITYGRTIWYAMRADISGFAEIQASGFDAVVAGYEYDPDTEKITRELGCFNQSPLTEDVFLELDRGRAYALQIGGVDAGAGPAGGLLHLTIDFYPDADRDEIFDELDECPGRRGVSAFAGCLPELRSSPRIRWSTTAAGVRITSLTVRKVPRGALVRARCLRRCSLRQARRAIAARTVSLDAFRGKALRVGAVFELRVTRPPTPSGLYRYGAIGSYSRFTVRARDVKRKDRCLLPGSPAPRRRCR